MCVQIVNEIHVVLSMEIPNNGIQANAILILRKVIFGENSTCIDDLLQMMVDT